jgi:hypothetical protein
MAFMEHQITDKQYWYEVDGPQGTEYIPADVVGCMTTVGNTVRVSTVEELRMIDGELPDSDNCRYPVPSALADYCENKEAWRIDLIQGYGARISAPGYMDRTEWSVFDTPEKAQEYLDKYYPDEDEYEDDGCEDCMTDPCTCDTPDEIG